ncbi:MAG: BACON domain-containing protein, partial [bacterium]
MKNSDKGAIFLALLLFGLSHSHASGEVQVLPGIAPPALAFVREVRFPETILAGGKIIIGEITFVAPGGNLASAEFKVVQATDFKEFTLDLRERFKESTSGKFPFEISTSVPQRVVLEIVLVDTKGRRSVPYTLRFKAVEAPCFTAEPEQLEFRMGSDGALPPTQSVTLVNTAEAPVRWAAESNVSWLAVTPADGTLSASGRNVVQVEIRPAQLTPEASEGLIKFSTAEIAGCERVVPVKIERVKAPAPAAPVSTGSQSDQPGAAPAGTPAEPNSGAAEPTKPGSGTPSPGPAVNPSAPAPSQPAAPAAPQPRPPVEPTQTEVIPSPPPPKPPAFPWMWIIAGGAGLFILAKILLSLMVVVTSVVDVGSQTVITAAPL